MRIIHFPSVVAACVALFIGLDGTAHAATAGGFATGIKFTKATLLDGWMPSGQGSAYPCYARDSLGVVHLRGAVKGPAQGDEAFKLPKALAPGHDVYLPILNELPGGDGRGDRQQRTSPSVQLFA